MNNELVPIQFHGDTLEAVQDSDGIWVSIKRCCEALDVSMPRQLNKLKSLAWAVVASKGTTASDGKQYETAVIHIKSLPLWLATINARRVKEVAREKLAIYQKECADVLAAHFCGQTVTAPGVDDGAIVRLSREMARMQLTIADLSNQVGSRQQAMPALPRTTVAERLRWKGWLNTSKKHRIAVRRQANMLLSLRHNEVPDVLCGTHIYYGHQIAVLDEAIDRVREDVEKSQREKEKGGLFEKSVA